METARISTLLISVTGFFVFKSYLSEQVECLDTNVTLIETFQNCRGPQEKVDVFRQIFGHNPVLWFIPIASSLPPNYSELIYPSSHLTLSDAHELDVDITLSADLSKKVD